MHMYMGINYRQKLLLDRLKDGQMRWIDKWNGNRFRFIQIRSESNFIAVARVSS